MPEPTLWRGPELFRHPAFDQTLTPAHQAALETYLAQTQNRSAEAIATHEIPNFDPLSTGIAEALEHGPGVVLLRRLPVDTWDQPARERAFWALGLALGTPVSQSASGQRLFPVRDAGYAPSDPRFRGPMSHKRLSFHTDRTDVIAFLCIQPAAEGGETYVVNSQLLHDELARRDPAALETLRQPFPYLRHTVDQGNQRPYCEIPVFSEHQGHFGAHFLRVLIDRADKSPDAPSLTEAQRQALDTLENLAEDPTLHAHFHMEPGDVLFLNNWTTFHRRSEFRDSENPQQRRHLLRIWLSMPNSRPIDPRFQPHFGATAAGALRGGMTPI